MEPDELIEQILGAWRRHNEIMIHLLREIPPAGMAALPAGSRGRTVALQFHHLDRVRRAWLLYHTTGKRPEMARADKDHPPGRAELVKALRASGNDVEDFLERAMREGVRPRMFNRDAIRWMTYLIAHEAHHRGNMLLALKQSGVKVGPKVLMDGLWGKWIYGK